MDLTSWLENEAINLGWDYFGAADIRAYYDYLESFCGDFIRKYPVAISLIFRLSDAVVDSILKQEPDKQLSFNNYCYHGVDHFINTSTVKLARMIEKKGFKAYPVPASYGVYPEKLAGLISHKLVAKEAGLGWVGKSGLFLTPEDGPRVRLATILTDADLITGEPVKNKCGKCTICIDACPAGAISNVDLETHLPQVDVFKCYEYQEERKKSWNVKIDRCICGLCQAICPRGQKA
ncbi:MAG: epoxyqueuosine reductase [Syntrophomonadaceae bacterium]|nr:epoxyqueuosine reductase [Syntrophomonadaceae bacterium]